MDARDNPNPITESPFHEHFNTNYIPTDAEIDLIRAHLVPHEAELARLEALIRDLTVQRDEMKDYIDSHKALISHPRRLPQDVIEQIFLACLPTRHNAIMSPAEAPLLLGRICSAWRSIAFAMPRLWASLHISVDFIDDSEERKAAVDHWLMRSFPLPLALSASWDDYYVCDQDVIELLIRSSQRWHVVHLSNIPKEHFFLLAKANAPLLADIQIRFQLEFYGDEGPQVLASNLFHAMNSQVVTILSPDPGALVPMTPFKWDHLAHLDLKSSLAQQLLNCETAFRLLRGCPHLRSLKVPLQPSGHGNEFLMLPCLESLIIFVHDSGFRVMEELVDQLIMPRLTQFHLLSIFYPASAIPVPNILSLKYLADYSPLISDLSLTLSDFTKDRLVVVLRCFPRLEKLHLVALYGASDSNGPWFPPKPNPAEFLAAFAPDTSSPHLCPALQELITEHEESVDDIWVNFLQKHLDCGTGLRRFQLNFQCEPPEIIPDVQPFLACGLDVSLKYNPVVKGPRFTPWEGIER